MTKSSKTTKVAVAAANENPAKQELVSTEPMSIAGNIIAFDAQTLKALCVTAACTLFAAPQFATQTNPNNVLGLVDLFYGYITGKVLVSQNNQEVAKQGAETGEQKFA